MGLIKLNKIFFWGFLPATIFLLCYTFNICFNPDVTIPCIIITIMITGVVGFIILINDDDEKFCLF